MTPVTSRPAAAVKSAAMRIAAVIALLAVVAPVLAADSARASFRPCIDPSNLPFANDKGEGFENKIAALFASRLGVPVASYSFPQRMNFIRNTLRFRLPGEDFRCDIVMSIPATYDQALPTVPYYRSTYALVYRKNHGLDQVKTGDDFLALPPDVRSKLRIGFFDKSPAGTWLVKHGMEAQAKPYAMMSPDPAQYPGQIIDTELAQGKIDAAIVWGPIAGYYAKRVAGVEFVVIPLRSEPGVKFDYAMAMGVRRGENDWKAQIDKLIQDNQPAINRILHEYDVPLIDAKGEPMG